MSTSGPMTRSVEDAIKIARFMNDETPSTMFLPFVPWNNDFVIKKVGIIKGFSIVPPCKAI